MRKSNIKPMIGMILLFSSPRRHGHIDEHIFEEDSVARGRIVDEDVRHRADDLAVLDNRASAHECGQEGTTVFNKKFTTKYWLNFCRNSL